VGFHDSWCDAGVLKTEQHGRGQAGDPVTKVKHARSVRDSVINRHVAQNGTIPRFDTVLLRKCEAKQSACFMIFTECPIHRGLATLGHAEKGVKNEFRNGTESCIDLVRCCIEQFDGFNITRFDGTNITICATCVP
jgi:hypothetical protein